MTDRSPVNYYSFIYTYFCTHYLLKYFISEDIIITNSSRPQTIDQHTVDLTMIEDNCINQVESKLTTQNNWSCDLCTFLNPSTAKRCTMCENIRSNDKKNEITRDRTVIDSSSSGKRDIAETVKKQLQASDGSDLLKQEVVTAVETNDCYIKRDIKRMKIKRDDNSTSVSSQVLSSPIEPLNNDLLNKFHYVYHPNDNAGLLLNLPNDKTVKKSRRSIKKYERNDLITGAQGYNEEEENDDMIISTSNYQVKEFVLHGRRFGDTTQRYGKSRFCGKSR